MDEKTLKILEFDKIAVKIADLASTAPGKEIASALSPEKDITIIQDMLNETDDAVTCFLRKGSPPPPGNTDMRDILRRLDMDALLSPGELLKLAGNLRACKSLKNYMDDRIKLENNIISSLIKKLETNRALEEKIFASIQSEEELYDDASPELQSIRRHAAEKHNSIKDSLNEMIRSSRYQKFIQEPLVTIRENRYVIPVKQECRSEVPGIVHDMSASGATVYIEPMAVVEKNNAIRQLKIKEQREIERILGEISAEAALMLPALKSNISILARLDFIFAKAIYALDNNCSRPLLNNNGCTFLKKARHPLLDAKSAVPIDFRIGGDFDTLIITGPNTGGKTVSLKTAGLLTIMAQSGLFVPCAESTEIRVFGKIFADIGDEQGIEQSLSTFSSHMTNIVRILKEADRQSLVLLDELGAGTDPVEGAALGMAIIETLRMKESVNIATTHYSELKIFAISTPGVENACCEFDTESLKPTFRLLIGIPGRSNAFAVSKRLGLDDDVLSRAREFLTQEDVRFEDIMITIEKNRNETEKERIRTEVLRMETERLKKELEEQKRIFDIQKDGYITEAKEEARALVLNTKKQAAEIIGFLKKLESEKDDRERRKAVEEARKTLKSSLDSIEQSVSLPESHEYTLSKPPEKLLPGDEVMILTFGSKGTVIEPPGSDGIVLVQAGIMKISIRTDDLRLIDRSVNTREAVQTVRSFISKTINISPEISVRGMLLNDALEKVDKYLDEASMASLGEVMIIHGKGEGILRNGIRQLLKSHPHVAGFRAGKYGEGDAGVTVVALK